MNTTLIDLNKTTLRYGVPLDGLGAFGTPLLIYAIRPDTHPLLLLGIGAVIHGIIHPIITTAK